MRLRIVIASVVLLSGFARASDNCFLFDRSTWEGRQHYAECKEQAQASNEMQARTDRFSDTVNQDTQASAARAQTADESVRSNAALLQLLRQMQSQQ